MLDPDCYDRWFRAGLDEKLGVGEFFERSIEAIYSHLLRPGDTAIDCGANRGRHTFPLSRCVGQSGRVIGVEAVPDLASALRQRLAAEGCHQVALVNQALGSHVGRVTFSFVKGLDGWSGISQRKDLPAWAVPTVEQLDLPMTTLDSIIRDQGLTSVRFVKMDLEGGEYHSLRGGPGMLERPDAPLIIFENGRQVSADLYHYSRDDWFDLFNSAGYRTFDLFGRRFTPDQWSVSGIPWYYIAAKQAADVEFVEARIPELVSEVERVFAAPKV